FGKKDYQQLMVVRKMCRQFQLPVEILAHETVREDDGLAMSSRNRYLTPDERAEAAYLYATLLQMRQRVLQGNVAQDQLEADARAALTQRGWDVDYFVLRRQRDLLAPTSDEIRAGEPLVILAAAH